MKTNNICECGSHILSSSSIYGGTFNLISVTMAIKERNRAYLFFKENYYLKEVGKENKEKIKEKIIIKNSNIKKEDRRYKKIKNFR